MLRAVHTAATGMESMQTNLDNIANNLSNVNTTAFKKDRAEFQDLFYNVIREPGAKTGPDSQSPTGVQVGTGVKTASVHKDFSQGVPKPTKNPLDLMVSGQGFFALQRDNGEVVYTRDGTFKLDNTGRIVSTSGMLLNPTITIPSDAQGISIAPNGEVSVRDSAGKQNAVGKIDLVNFVNASGLLAAGGNSFAASEASGPPIQSAAGENGLGNILQGHLEASNVNLVEEMVNMIQAQRAYEMNTKVLSTADNMMSASNNVIK